MSTKLFSLLGATNPKRYLKSASWVILTRIISLTVSLASTFYIARTLGPQNFGELNYAISIVNTLAFFAAIASGLVITRDLVKNHGQREVILGTGWILSFVGTILTILSVAILTLFLPHDYITFYIVAILCLAQLCSTFQIVQNVFYADANTKYLSFTQLGIHISVSVAKVIAMTQGQGVLVLAAIMFFEQLFSAFIMLCIYYRYYKTFPWQWNWSGAYAKKLAVDSLPFVFITMSIVVAGRIDQIFIKHFIDTTAVGMYGVAVQLTELWQVIPQLLLASFFPALINAHTSGTNYAKRIWVFIFFLAFYSLVISTTTTLLAPFIVPIIYGAAFLPGIPLLQIYVWSLFGTVAGFLITNILVTENQRRIQIIVGLVPMILNIVLNLIFIPTHGAAGAAWATVVSYSIAPIIPFFFSAVRSKLFTYQNTKML